MKTDQADLGELLRDGDRLGLRFVRHFSHPAARVWRALTESDQLRYWLPCDIVGERRVGAAITLPFWPAQVEQYEIEESTLTGHIEIWDPVQVFQWTWDGDVLRFELEETGSGTTLTFTTWLGDPDPEGAVNVASGYHVCFEELRRLVDTGTGLPLPEADAAAQALRPVYADRLGLG